MTSSTAAQPVLRVASASKRFGGIQALDSVSMDLLPGEVHALCGANGAGKSTLKNVISGALRPDEGGIFVDGQRVDLDGPRDAMRLGIHAVHQELGLLPSLTVEENLFLGRFDSRAGVIRSRELRSSAQRVLEDFGLLVSPSAKVGTLSVGQQQLVEIVRAVSSAPKVLLLDEPSAVLVGPELDRVFETVRQLRSEGVAIVYVSHRLDEVFDLADRVTVLRNGAHVLTAPIDEMDHDRLVAAMIGEAATPGSGRIRETSVTTPAERPILEVHSLQAGEGRLRSIDLHVQPGEIVGIAGLMGSGRSHLLKCIFGIDKLADGEVVLDGERVSPVTPQKMMSHGVAFVPEDRKTSGLFIDWPIKHNLTLPGLRRRTGRLVDPSNERTKAVALAERVGVPGSRIDDLVSQLSGGNQQKVAIGRWLSEEPRLLLIDEPTRGVDVGAKSEIYRILSQLTAHGTGVLVVSSEFDELLQVCDRLIVMDDGEVRTECDPATTTSEDLLHMCTRTTKADVNE